MQRCGITDSDYSPYRYTLTTRKGEDMFSFRKHAVGALPFIVIQMMVCTVILRYTWRLSKEYHSFSHLDDAVPSAQSTTRKSEQPLQTSRPNVLLKRYGYVINKPMLCETSSNISVLIIAISAPGNFELRQAIRETWGNASTQRGLKVAFFLGRPNGSDGLQHKIFDENEVYTDIIQADFSDTYENLTLKSVLMIRWTNTFCSKAAFLLKIDDDVMLSVWDLRMAAKDFRGTRRTIWGYLYPTPAPNRNPESKWYVSNKTYPNATFPDFVAGPSYLVSADSIPLLDLATNKEDYLHLEDVFLTGIVAERAGVRRVSELGFKNYRDYLQPCSLPTVITSHGYTAEELRNYWRLISSAVDEKLCGEAGYP